MKYENEEEYYRALCILFLPFREEKSDIHSHDVKALYNKHKPEIEANRSQFEKHKTLIDEIEKFEKDEINLDDLEDDDTEYIDDETTAEKDIEDFEQSLKAQAKKMLSNFNEGKIDMDDKT